MQTARIFGVYYYYKSAGTIKIAESLRQSNQIGGNIMFQIKRVDMITKTFRFPEDMLKELEILAQKNNISVNKLVIQCCPLRTGSS